MSFWQNLRDQLLNLWNRWSLSQRVGFSAAAVACIAAVVGTMIWATQPEYVVIARNRETGQIFDIAGILDTEKIPYEINVSSTAISVPTAQVNEAHMALKDLLHPEEISQAKSSGFPMFQSPRAEEDQRLRDLEARVQRMIKNIRGIESATVNISAPEKSPFAEDKVTVTAAVLVVTRSDTRMTNLLADHVINLVARSVPDLDPDNVVVSDNVGRQFSRQTSANTQIEDNLKIERDIERELEMKAQSAVNAFAGVRSKIVVNANIDFTKQTLSSTLYDPEKTAILSESTQSMKTKNGTPQPVGVAGTGSNVAANATPPASSTADTQESNSENTYAASETRETLEKHGGDIKKLTVSAVVDLSDVAPAPAAPGTPAAPALDDTAIEELIRGAIGEGSENKDEIFVHFGKVAPTDDLAIPTAAPIGIEQWIPLAQYVSLGLGALVAFVMGLLMIKRMKPIVIKETVGPGIPLADARRLASVSEQAKAHPELVANILSAWLNEQETLASADKTPPPTSPTTETPRGSRGASVPKSSTTSPQGVSQERRAA